MNITIKAVDKWSVSLRDWAPAQGNGDACVPIAKTAKQLDKVKSAGQPLKSSDHYETHMSQLGQHRPNFRYNPITHNTVLGILAHCVGEIRPLSTILSDPNHPVTRLGGKMSFYFDRSSYQNEVMRLACPPKNSTKAAGFIHAKHAQFSLAVDSDFSSCVWSVLDGNDASAALGLLQTLKNPTANNLLDIFARRSENTVNTTDIQRHMARWEAITKDIKKNNPPLWKQFCTLAGVNTDNIGGTLFLEILRVIGQHHPHWQEEVVKLKGTKRALSGIDPKKHTFSFKEYANRYFGIKVDNCEHAFVYQMAIDGTMLAPDPMFNKASKTGITKESGTLEIHLDLAPEEAAEVKTMLAESGVNVFQVGKKGLGYISCIYDPSF